MGRRLTTRLQTASLLSTLFQRTVEVRVRDDVSAATGAIATYRESDGRLSGAMWASVDFTIASAAALCLLSDEHMEEARNESDYLPQRWHEHFAEIANICARFFGALEAPRVALDSVWIAPTAPPTALMDEMEDLLQHRVFDVNLGNYGKGQLHLVAL